MNYCHLKKTSCNRKWVCTTLHFSSILELIHKCIKNMETKSRVNVGSLVLKTIQIWSVFCHRKDRVGWACPLMRAVRVTFYSFIINTIKVRLIFWFFFLYLNIQEHSLSNVHHHQYYKERDTNRKKRWKMLIKLKELNFLIFLIVFFIFFHFCSF